MQLLLAAAADPDISNAHGWSALHCAIRDGQTEAVKLLLTHGCGDIMDSYGEFPLDLAIRIGREEEAYILSSANAVCPASDPSSILERRIRINNNKQPSTITKKSNKRAKKGKKEQLPRRPTFETGRVLDHQKSCYGTRFQVQFDCDELNMPLKLKSCCSCSCLRKKKQSGVELNYDYDKCEKKVHLKHFCYIGAPFSILDRLSISTSSAMLGAVYTAVPIPLILQPRPAKAVGRGYGECPYQEDARVKVDHLFM